MAATATPHERDVCKKYRRSSSRLKKAEVRQIERHQRSLSIERGVAVDFEEAARDWLKHHAQAWREERQRKMMAMQREEINRYKWIQSEHAHRDLGGKAVLEWIHRYAAHWREWYEEEYVDD